MQEPSRPNYEILTHRFVESGQWDRALAASMEWLGREPENGHAHRVAAQALINLDQRAGAQTHIAHVLASNPRDDFAHRLMSMVHFDQRRFREADESIRKAIELNPRDAFHWHFLAQMSYRQGDSATAKKCAERALELRPRDPDILNLLILCEPNQPGAFDAKIRRYEEALELDPENSNIHNNIGVQYLAAKNFDKAEECFRRALFFEPASKLIRKNLFITVKHRDKVYRTLCAPKDFLFKASAFFTGMRKQNMLFYILLIPIWLLAFRFVIVGLLAWFMWVWPLTKVYEYLFIGDILARTGELGARRGGFLGYRTWPLQARLSLFALILVSFWGGIAYVVWSGGVFQNSENQQVAGGLALFAAMIFFIGYRWRLRRNKGINPSAAKRRAQQVKTIFEPETKPRKWWQFFRGKTETT